MHKLNQLSLLVSAESRHWQLLYRDCGDGVVGLREGSEKSD